MSQNPEQAMANASALESAAWQPLIDGQKAAMAATDKASAVARTAQNFTEHYEALIARAEKEHQTELELLEGRLGVVIAHKEADISEKLAELAIKDVVIANKDLVIAHKDDDLAQKDIDIAVLSAQAKKNGMSSYHYGIERDALYDVIEEEFGEAVAEQLEEKAIEKATKEIEDRGPLGPDRHRLWGS